MTKLNPSQHSGLNAISVFALGILWLLSGCSTARYDRYISAKAEGSQQKILWSPQPLKPADFKGPKDAPYRLPSGYFVLTPRYDTSQQHIRFGVTAWFIPEIARIGDSANTVLIQHEQIHFDMTELYGRRLRKALSDTVFHSVDYQSVIRELFKRYSDDLKAAMAEYEKDSKQGRFKAGQAYWTDKVTTGLREFSAYTDTLVIAQIAP